MDPLLASARKTVTQQADALHTLAATLDARFAVVARQILACTGRVVVCGVGKSGLVGRKIAATLASTGTPSFFLHPTEALHGDLGMLTADDVLLALSRSGETEELVRLLPFARRRCSAVIAMVGSMDSALARGADLVLPVPVDAEADPLQLAPTTSTTAAMVLGDALALALMEARGEGVEDFAALHPGGQLGRRLLSEVGDLMQSQRLPVVAPGLLLSSVISVMTRGRLGLAVVADGERIVGLITDGDLRRLLEQGPGVLLRTASAVMTPSPKWIAPDTRATHARQRLTTERITSLLVSPDGVRLVGVVHIHHLNQALGSSAE
ncbi:MAG: arabinose-5-phosphate isomerase [Myxococcota bacterium]|jgi:arabinose-5-phosphate isomerase